MKIEISFECISKFISLVLEIRNNLLEKKISDEKQQVEWSFEVMCVELVAAAK